MLKVKLTPTEFNILLGFLIPTFSELYANMDSIVEESYLNKSIFSFVEPTNNKKTLAMWNARKDTKKYKVDVPILIAEYVIIESQLFSKNWNVPTEMNSLNDKLFQALLPYGYYQEHLEVKTSQLA